MASLFDQYEQLRSVSSTPPIATSYVGARLSSGVARSSRPMIKSADEIPLLKRHRIDFEPDEPITHLTASNNQIVIATKDKRLMFIDVTNNAQVEYDLSRHLGDRFAMAKIYRLFLDPTGKFTLISLTNQADGLPLENVLYAKRMQSLPKLRGHLISAVAWNYSVHSPNDRANSTGTILVGTSKGLIFQTELVAHDEPRFFPLSTTPEQYVRQVFDVGLELAPITGLEYHQVVHQLTASVGNNPTEKRFHIMITTNNRLYRMLGNLPANVEPPHLQHVFSANANRYQDMPGKLGFSKLDLYYPAPPPAPPTRFAWLTEPGILTGEIYSYSSTNQASASQTGDSDKTDGGQILISYTNNNDCEFSSDFNDLHTPLALGMSDGGGGGYLSRFDDRPLSVLVTKFHILILFRRYLRAICTLNEQTVYEEYLPSDHGSILGMSKDPVKNIVWMFSERAVFRYRLSQEDKNIWRIYLDKGDYEMAKRYSIKQPKNYDRVLCEEAEFHYNHGNHCKSAELFAKSKKTFEEIALKFMQTDRRQALIRFLVIKINMLQADQAIQLTMILAWLIEILLSEMSRLRCLEKSSEDTKIEKVNLEIGKFGNKALTSTEKSFNFKGKNDINEELKYLENEFMQSLQNDKTRNCIGQNPSLYYGIVRNYADVNNYIRMAAAIGDYERIVQHYMNEQNYERALEMMKRSRINQLFYLHCPILMRHIPDKTIDALIKHFSSTQTLEENKSLQQKELDIIKLIPTILQEPRENRYKESIRFLEFCLEKCDIDDEIVHNLLFELYARYRRHSVIPYLNSYQHRNDDSIDPLNDSQQKVCAYLDLEFGLRLCTELGLDEARVLLYSAMNRHDEALKLALEFDVELAKRIANKAESDEHKKKLWLTISEHVLRKNHDIKQAMKILQEFSLLKIEDILPFFPDYTNIDFFRDAIRQSLTEYKRIINELRDGTPEAMAREISTEIIAFRNRYSVIKADRRCDVCTHPLLTGSFYAFPCGHLFHCECMISELSSILTPEQMAPIDEIRRELSELDNQDRSPKHSQQSALAFLYNTTRDTYMNSTIGASIANSDIANLLQQQEQKRRRTRAELVDELNKLASKECVFCGEALALTVDRPFEIGLFD